MAESIVLGICADSDGTLIANRGGYDATRLFAPELAAAMAKAIELSGMFTIASAAHIKRASMLLAKAGNQLPIERMLFFAENGYAVLVPVKTARGHELEIHRAVMPGFVTTSNLTMRNALDELCECALEHGLFMFANRDKEAKVTVELMGNGRESNQRIAQSLVVPFLVKKLKFPTGALQDGSGTLSLRFPELTYRFIPTWSSIEVDHSYLTTKKTVNTVIHDLVRLLWARAFGSTSPRRDRVFIGFGDSPRDSDEGILDPLRGNIGFSIQGKQHALGPQERLIDLIMRASDPPFITLPVFSPGGKVQLGNGSAVSSNLARVLLTGTYFRIKDSEAMRAALREVLREARYVATTEPFCDPASEMYTTPPYLSAKADADDLMNRFLRSDTPDSSIDAKISAVCKDLDLR
jgi:hypothetical protein